MKTTVSSRVLMNGQKNCAVHIIGILSPGPESGWLTVVEAKKFGASRVKLDHVEWAITSALEVFLAWHVEGALDGGELIIPLAGRGTLNFSDYGGLTNELEGRSGNIELRVQVTQEIPRGQQAFALFLDLIKQE